MYFVRILETDCGLWGLGGGIVDVEGGQVSDSIDAMVGRTHDFECLCT